MLARAAGHTLGVAKHINPVVVRVATTDVESYLEGLSKILMDIGDGKRAVLQLALYWERKKKNEHGVYEVVFKNDDGTDGYDYIRQQMSALLKKIAEKGVSIVCGSGNNVVTSIDGLPASLADPKQKGTHIDSLLVVGALSLKDDERWYSSNVDESKGIPHVYAAGKDIECPEFSWETMFDPKVEYRPVSGTSPGELHPET
jgi:hypothetical protein